MNAKLVIVYRGGNTHRKFNRTVALSGVRQIIIDNAGGIYKDLVITAQENSHELWLPITGANSVTSLFCQCMEIFEVPPPIEVPLNVQPSSLTPGRTSARTLCGWRDAPCHHQL